MKGVLLPAASLVVATSATRARGLQGLRPEHPSARADPQDRSEYRSPRDFPECGGR
jgi:hypothetical protein